MRKKTSGQVGFTLLELLIVFSMIGVIAAFSMSLYMNLNSSRNKQKAAEDLVTVLNQARSYSLSQVKKCAGTLSSYEVVVNYPSNSCYSLFVNCTNDDESSAAPVTLDTKCLPNNVTFSSSQTFSFPIQGEGAVSPASVRINSAGSYVTVSVDDNGIIIAQ